MSGGNYLGGGGLMVVIQFPLQTDIQGAYRPAGDGLTR